VKVTLSPIASTIEMGDPKNWQKAPGEGKRREGAASQKKSTQKQGGKGKKRDTSTHALSKGRTQRGVKAKRV